MRPTIAVDFDGTLAITRYPEIIHPRDDMLAYVKWLKGEGYALILWTCREGKLLEDAVRWCEDHGLVFDAINDNIPERVELFGTNTRKVGADYYLDDLAIPVPKMPYYLAFKYKEEK